MTKIIPHNDSWKTGTRVMMLTARNKDGVEEKRHIQRISHDVDQFNKLFDELLDLARPGERIYAAASPRDLRKATLLLKQRQVQAEFDADPTLYYKNFGTKWISCLMNKSAIVRGEKYWLWDCDTTDDYMDLREELAVHLCPIDPLYKYETKNGWHVITPAFDYSDMSDRTKALRDGNPVMLHMWSDT